MKKLISIIGLLVLVCAGSVFSAKVTGVNIFRSDINTVAQIDVEGDVRFTHQTEIAKDGKPFRIIVDILAATHEMNSKSFTNLPNCGIVGIRSSQYSVDPEQIVRVVFDMKNESEYRIESEENSVIIYISDPDTKQFQFWSSQDFMSGLDIASAPVSESVIEPTIESTKTVEAQPDIASIIAAINESIDADRQTSLEPASEEQQAKNDELANTADEPSSEDVKVVEPEVAQEDLNPTVDEPEFLGPIIPENLAGTDDSEKTDAASSKPADETNKIEKKSDSEPEQVKEEKSTQPTKKTLGSMPKSTLPTPPNKTEPNKLAEVTTDNSEKTSTARFRRSPVDSRRIKGTLVAEFPTRLVIKYKGKQYRDPFETLIDETKVSQNPMEVNIPNVEGLRLVGIIESSGNGNRALFEDKSGYGYILKAGDKVQKGYVLRVDSDKVYFQIFEYGWSRTVALDMEMF